MHLYPDVELHDFVIQVDLLLYSHLQHPSEMCLELHRLDESATGGKDTG